jgi:hypothetical protein
MVFMQGLGRFGRKFAANHQCNPSQLGRILIEQFSLIDLLLEPHFFSTQSRHDGFGLFRLDVGRAEQFVELIEGYDACLAAHFDGSTDQVLKVPFGRSS